MILPMPVPSFDAGLIHILCEVYATLMALHNALMHSALDAFANQVI